MTPEFYPIAEWDYVGPTKVTSFYNGISEKHLHSSPPHHLPISAAGAPYSLRSSPLRQQGGKGPRLLTTLDSWIPGS